MSFTSFAGSFNFNNSTGNQAITGVGFTPSIVFLQWNTKVTSDGSDEGLSHGFGILLSATQFATHTYFQNGIATSNAEHGYSTTKCIIIANGSASLPIQAQLVSLDSDGFTINVTSAPGTVVRIAYLALGGTAITNTKIFNITAKTSTGSQATTGIGFQPDGILTFGMAATASAPNLDTNAGVFCFGAAYGSNSLVSAICCEDNVAAALSKTGKYQTTGKCLIGLAGGRTKNYEASLTSFDSDGFTLNYTTAAGSAWQIFGLAIKGIGIDIGVFNGSASNIAQSVTGINAPIAQIFASACAVTSSTLDAGARHGIGFIDNSGHRNHTWCGAADTSATTNSSFNFDSAKCIKSYTENGVSPALTTVADFTSQNSDGFTITWSTTDGATREIGYLSFYAPATPVSVSDNLTVSITDTSSVVAALSVSDNVTVSITDASTNALTSGLSDSLSLSITDASTNVLSSNVSDDLSVSLSELLQAGLIFNVTDDLELSISERSAANKVAETYYRRYLNDVS